MEFYMINLARLRHTIILIFVTLTCLNSAYSQQNPSCTDGYLPFFPDEIPIDFILKLPKNSKVKILSDSSKKELLCSVDELGNCQGSCSGSCNRNKERCIILDKFFHKNEQLHIKYNNNPPVSFCILDKTQITCTVENNILICN